MTIREMYTAMQSQKAVSAYFTSKQILPFAFAVQYSQGVVLTLSPQVISFKLSPV